MTLKTKISFLTSLLFTILFGLSSLIIFLLFSNFRKEEFRYRLEKKALSTMKLLVEVQEIDNHLLRLIDKNTIHELIDEKTLVFDTNYTLIYSSIDDTKINWTLDDLNYLKQNKTFFKKDGNYEIYGVFHDTKDKDYYALISATDNYGKRKLEYLVFILIISYVIFTPFCWLVTSYAVQNLLEPLDIFHYKIKNINANNLDTRLEVKKGNNEIDLIANEFNMMMQRIDNSYQKQKEFAANASHELRTPLARILSQVENKIQHPNTNQDTKSFLKNILSNVNQLSELIHSLLILSKLDTQKLHDEENHRLDEIIYDCIEKLNKTYPDFKIILNIDFSENIDALMEIKGRKSLLEIAIINLLKNAYIYSNNKQADVTIAEKNNILELTIFNTGKSLSTEEQKYIFQPFMRGKNAVGISGLGLGLRMVQRILLQHNTKIEYNSLNDNSNLFKISFAST
jgi:two-component system, OmpR family, sensor histidine kinase ArlS